MDEDTRAYGLYSGFVDYAFCFPKPEVIWIMIGVFFLVVTIGSYIPQVMELYIARSSYGLAGASAFSQVFGLCLVAYNVICLKFSDFVGALQYPTLKTIPRLLTFINLFSQVVVYLPVVFFVFILHDIHTRPNRNRSAVRSDRVTEILFGILSVFAFLFLLLIWIAIGVSYGFDCDAIKYIGRIAGVIATFMEFAQYVPQIWMTIRLKDHGNLSLLMLKIQAPTNLANALFMWIGQGEDFTTFSASALDATFEFFLLGTCYFFIWKKSIQEKKKRNITESSMTLLQEIDPVSYESLI